MKLMLDNMLKANNQLLVYFACAGLLVSFNFFFCVVVTSFCSSKLSTALVNH